MFLSTIPVAPMMTVITSTFLSHILVLYLETHILAHFLSDLLLDVVVTWDSHIDDHTSF